jgi:general secretion pathway protein G
MNAPKCEPRGFTLIELLVVLAIVAMLLTLAQPRYFQSIDHSKEAILKTNLQTMRQTIDKFYADTGRYPDSLEELVDEKYLRSIPVDPLTESASSWVLLPPEDADLGKVYDVTTSAPGTGKDGTAYADW